MRRTKIVCTIGPSSNSVAVLGKLIDAGLNVARLNFSHGNHKSHLQVMQMIEYLSEKKGVPVAILQDLAGPKIRIGKIAEGRIELKSGKQISLVSEKTGGSSQISVSHPELLTAVEKGDPVLLADGSIELRVVRVSKDEVICEVLVGGVLTSNKGINLPGRSLSLKALTDKDKTDLAFGLENEVDYVAMSFVRRHEEIAGIKKIISAAGKSTPVIAKIEKHEALENIDEIINIVDGLMVARGDLAVETALARVPVVQKMLIKKCNQACKPVITATQMLKSMVDNPRPTRAEANDVANAVLDGTDAVMLSEETASGKYPVEAVATMARIIEQTEMSSIAIEARSRHEISHGASIASAVSRSAYEMAKDLGAAAIITPTQSGSTARMVSAHRPDQPIVAMSPMHEVVRRMGLIWGVHPLLAGSYRNSEEMIEQAKKKAVKSGLVKKGETVVITAGVPLGIAGTTNLIKAEVVK